MQLAMLLALWTTFLLSQLLKANYKHCTWEFGAIAGGQAMTLAAFTAAVMAFQSWKAKVPILTASKFVLMSASP